MVRAAVDPLVVARCGAQLLSGPRPAAAEQAVRHLLAVQGQDPRGFRLAVRARTDATTAADVDAGLTDRRALVVSWLHRGTLHLVAAEDYHWLHALTTPQLAVTAANRLAQEGVAPEATDRGVAAVVEALQERGALGRDDLRTAVAAAGVPVAGQALVHVLLTASLRHHVIRGPVVGGDHRMVLAEQHLGPAPALPERPVLLARLAERYLAAHGPASPRDLAYWAGLPLRDARAGFGALTDRTRPVPSPDDDDLVDLVDRPSPDPAPTRLLGNFDPLLHGWRSRRPVLGEHDGAVVAGGVFRSTALVDGRAVGLWRVDGGRIRIAPFAPLPRSAERALLRDAADVRRFLALPDRDAVVEAA